MISPSRRDFLTSLGAATVVGTTGTFNATADSDTGRVVFIYDDGPAEDYDAFRIHREENVPGCSAVITEKLDTDGHLTASQVRTMDADGWEIMSHTLRHRALDEIALTDDVQAGDDRLPVKYSRHGAIPNDQLVVADARHEETVTVTGREETDETAYLTLETPLVHEYRVNAGASERYTDKIVRRALTESKVALEDLGVSVANVIMPYGRYGKQAQRMVPQVYQAVGNATWDNGVNAYPEMSPYQMSRRYFKPGSMSESELGEFLDTVSERNALGILAGHTGYDEFSTDRLRTAIRMVKERNIEVVTLRQALIDANLLTILSTESASTAEPTTTSHRRMTTTRTTNEPRANSDATSRERTHSMVGSQESDLLGVGVLTGIIGASAGVLAKYRRKR